MQHFQFKKELTNKIAHGLLLKGIFDTAFA